MDTSRRRPPLTSCHGSSPTETKILQQTTYSVRVGVQNLAREDTLERYTKGMDRKRPHAERRECAPMRGLKGGNLGEHHLLGLFQGCSSELFIGLIWALMASPIQFAEARRRAHNALQRQRRIQVPPRGPDPHPGRMLTIKPAFYSCTGWWSVV
jgi:hypothetical protein